MPPTGRTAHTSSAARGAVAAVATYPAAPTAVEGTSHRVRAQGSTVFVERYEDVS